jgi:hypothetical protein
MRSMAHVVLVVIALGAAIACNSGRKGGDAMTPAGLREKVQALLAELEQQPPAAYDLGTPRLAETPAVESLVRMGPAIEPELIERMERSASKKQVAYAVLVLGRLGEQQALEPLKRLRERYEGRQSKDEWDFAVIGQCNTAISELQRRAQ